MIMNQSTYLVSVVNAAVIFGQADFRQVMREKVEADGLCFYVFEALVLQKLKFLIKKFTMFHLSDFFLIAVEGSQLGATLE